MNGAIGTHVSWFFCYAIANALLEALEILMEEALVFDKHIGSYRSESLRISRGLLIREKEGLP
jgi:hypothetical protein